MALKDVAPSAIMLQKESPSAGTGIPNYNHDTKTLISERVRFLRIFNIFRKSHFELILRQKKIRQSLRRPQRDYTRHQQDAFQV